MRFLKSQKVLATLGGVGSFAVGAFLDISLLTFLGVLMLGTVLIAVTALTSQDKASTNTLRQELVSYRQRIDDVELKAHELLSRLNNVEKKRLAELTSQLEQQTVWNEAASSRLDDIATWRDDQWWWNKETSDRLRDVAGTAEMLTQQFDRVSEHVDLLVQQGNEVEQRLGSSPDHKAGALSELQTSGSIARLKSELEPTILDSDIGEAKSPT